MHRCGPHNLALASPSAFALVLSSHLRLDPQLSHAQARSRAWRATPPSARSFSPATPPRAQGSRRSGQTTVASAPCTPLHAPPLPRPCHAPAHPCTPRHLHTLEPSHPLHSLHSLHLCRRAGAAASGSPRRRTCRLPHHASGRREDEAAARLPATPFVST